jgi:hypothetical protein
MHPIIRSICTVQKPITRAVAHAVVLLKSHKPDLDIEQLQRDFPFDNDEEWDALIDSVYDTAQHFVPQYDFSAINDPDDNGSPVGQS